MWIKCNNNPVGIVVGDCSVRAVSIALNVDWETAYAMLAANGFSMGDLMSSNVVIGATLRQHGFKKANIPNTCPECFTVAEFAEINPYGTFVLGTGNHVVTVVDGNFFDVWNSGDEVPIYVWYENVNPSFDI